jgi:hypothetical protein
MKNRLTLLDHPSVHGEVKLAKLTFIEVPEHQEQFHRPFKTVSMGGGNISDLTTLTNGGTNLTAPALASVAHTFLRPSDQPCGKVNIKNGFATKRFAFFLELVTPLHGTSANDEEVEVITGYTVSDYEDGGISPRHWNSDEWVISPDLVLVVNDRVTFTRQIKYGTFGGVIVRPQSPVMLLHNYGGKGTDYVPVRPQDVLNREHQMLAASTGRNHIRLDLTGDLDVTKLASARHNSPIQYLSDTLTSFVRSHEPTDRLTGAHPDHQQRIDNALGHLSMISSVSEQCTKSTYYKVIGKASPLKSQKFEIRDLENTWGVKEVDRVSVVFFIEDDAEMVDPLDTEGWGGVNTLTSVAYELSHVMPSLLMSMLLSELKIEINADTITGRPEIFIYEPLAIAEGYFNEECEEWLIGQILQEIVIGILDPHLHAGYKLSMTCRLTTNSDIWITADGLYEVPYSAPAFCSAIISPQVGTSDDHLSELQGSVIEMVDFVLNESNPFSHKLDVKPKLELPTQRDLGSRGFNPEPKITNLHRNTPRSNGSRGRFK